MDNIMVKQIMDTVTALFALTSFFPINIPPKLFSGVPVLYYSKGFGFSGHD
jgi:lipopolysaccharide/colanic/teichoic acid biosynthesis glycosyltransferase